MRTDHDEMEFRRGRLNFRAAQISGLVNGEELILLDKLLLQAGLGNQVGLRVEPRGADRANVILCRPFRDSILSVHLPGTSVPGS